MGKTVRISPGFMWMEGDIYFNKENELIRNNIQGRLGTYNNTSKTDPKNTLANDYKSQFSTLHLDSNETVKVFIKLNSDRIFTPSNLNVSIYDEIAYAEYRRYGLYIEGILAGAVLALCIFSFFA